MIRHETNISESRRFRSRSIQLLCALLAASIVWAQPPQGSAVPMLRGETLDDKPITLPAAAAGKVTLLLIGFSRKGGDNIGPWRDRFQQDFGNDSRVTAYSVAMLEDAPGLLRGMIKGSMRKGVPPDRRSHFVVCTSNEKAWKAFTGVSESQWPYLVLLDASGSVHWKHGGMFAERDYSALKTAAAELLRR